jgi:hypothetical protein
VQLFAERQGRVMLTASDHPLTAMAQVNVLELVLSGVGKHYDEARIEQEMGSALHDTVRATSAYARYAEHFRFRPTDEPLLSALREGTTLERLSAGGANRRRAAQIVYVLWTCQMLRVGEAAQKGVTTRPPTSAGRALPTPEAPAARSPPDTLPEPPAESDDATFMAELHALERKIETGAHAFDLLGVSLGAGKRELRRAWSDLSRRLHPDALQAKGRAHLRNRVSRVFAALSEAHAVLGDSEQREQLKAQIERGGAGSADATATVRAAFEAELLAKEGDRFLKASKFDRALSKYVEAMRLDPEELDFVAAAAWCRYQLSARDRTAALTAEHALSAVLGKAPAIARAHFFRGMVLKDLGRPDAAVAEFELAVHHDGRLIDAERQLRVLRPGQGGSRGARGLFGKR